MSGHSLIAEYDIEKKELFVNPLLNETPEDNKLFNYLRNNRYMTIGSVQQIIRSDDNVNLLFQVIEGKQDHCSFECRTAIENETIWIRINAQAYKTKGSKRQNKMICHITNITEEKLLEEKLHHAEYETRQSELRTKIFFSSTLRIFKNQQNIKLKTLLQLSIMFVFSFSENNFQCNRI